MFLNCGKVSSNVKFEGFVLRSLRASPLTRPFFAPGMREVVKNVYWTVSVSLKCVLIERKHWDFAHRLNSAWRIL